MSRVAPGELILPTDWDDVLCRTDDFSKDFLSEFAAMAGVPVQQVWTEVPNLQADPILGGYDLDKHIALHELEPSRVWSLLKDVVGSRNYLYEDSVPYIQELQKGGYQPWILSFGHDRLQRERIEPYIKRLGGIPFEIVLRKKAAYLAEVYPFRQGALVDDKPNQELPPGFAEITLDRSRQLSEPIEKPAGFVVSSLEQALQVIRRL